MVVDITQTTKWKIQTYCTTGKIGNGLFNGGASTLFVQKLAVQMVHLQLFQQLNSVNVSLKQQMLDTEDMIFHWTCNTYKRIKQLDIHRYNKQYKGIRPPSNGLYNISSYLHVLGQGARWTDSVTYLDYTIWKRNITTNETTKLCQDSKNKETNTSSFIDQL